MSPSGPPRRLFCNRTLNLRSIRAIGYDMDYTLIHYHTREWEHRAYEYIRQGLAADGWPVADLRFDPELVMRGLIIDRTLGNVVKADRFGYVKYAFHGTRVLELDEKKVEYRHTIVDLSEPRWVFMNTLFSISEACIYMQLVDLLDREQLHEPIGYGDLYLRVRRTLDRAHMEGRLKAEILADPDKFVDLDERVPRTLLDQKEAGKSVVLITNSEWEYASPMLRYAFDPFLPGKMTWRDLFTISIVGSRKPHFFESLAPAFHVVSDDGLLREHVGPLQKGEVYVGGNARLVESSLGLVGEQILYVGDHLFADVNVSKIVTRWRTALVIRELEDEIRVVRQFEAHEAQLSALMHQKETLEAVFSLLRLEAQRRRNGHAPEYPENDEKLAEKLADLRRQLVAIDEEITPLAQESASLLNPNWGLLMRTGKDKSHLARQVERYADIYMARVADFLPHTPFDYLRSHRGSLPHDLDPYGTADPDLALQPGGVVE